jgi:UDP-N-acetylmuramate dehydrogenase
MTTNSGSNPARPVSPVRLALNRSLAPLTSWKIGGPAAYYAEPADPPSLLWCLQYALDHRLSVFALGGGSNILVSDQGYPGLVLRYLDAHHNFPCDQEEGRLYVGAAASLARAARDTAADGWTGLEWAEGIPGTIGGAIVGNAGAFGGAIASSIRTVETLSLENGAKLWPVDQCAFGYRSSRFQPPAGSHLATSEFVVSAEFRLTRSEPDLVIRHLREISRERRARTPAGRTCGSVFRNPPGDSAGRLIEAVGLRGAEHGPAQISTLHANYIVNRGDATAGDVLALIDLARTRVRVEFGIELELEVRLVGQASDAVNS